MSLKLPRVGGLKTPLVTTNTGDCPFGTVPIFVWQATVNHVRCHLVRRIVQSAPACTLYCWAKLPLLTANPIV